MNQKLKKFLKKILFKDEYSEKQKILNIIMMGLFAGGSAETICAYFMGYKGYYIILSSVYIFIDLLCIYITNRLKKPKIASFIIAMIANNVCFPSIYILSGGLHKGMPVWFTTGLILTLLLVDGVAGIICFGINFCIFAGTVIYTELNPSVLITNTQLNESYDMIISVFLVTCVIGCIFRFESYIYEKQSAAVLDAVTKAKNANRSKEIFLSNVSHDIRTPMNAILGYTEIAKDKCDDRKKLIECFSRIHIASEQLLNLINGIMEMSQLNNDEASIREENCSIQVMINELEDLLQYEMSLKNLKLNIDLSKMVEDSVSMDKGRINRILINILTNAIHFSNDNGEIYLTVNQIVTEDKIGTVRTEFVIRDEGCGIREDFIDKIFEPFERERGVGKSEVNGVGLGLSIAQKLVEMLGGTITVKSKVNEGTEVTVILPLVIQNLTEITDELDEVSEEKIELIGKKILLVEDNSLNREIAVDVLTSAGCIVDEARDGTFAIEKVQMASAGTYDLILMDIQMPMMNGYEATKLIRSITERENRHIPIIALSANAFYEDKKKAFECGMDGFISKPVSTAKLCKVLNLVLKDI